MKRLVIPTIVMIACLCASAVLCKEADRNKDARIAAASLFRVEIAKRKAYKRAMDTNSKVTWPDLGPFQAKASPIPLGRFREVPGMIRSAADSAGIVSGPISIGVAEEGRMVVSTVPVVTGDIVRFRKFIENMAPFTDKVVKIGIKPDEGGTAYMVEMSLRFREDS